MIATLFITILTESMVIVVYCLWCRKPLRTILWIGLCGNLITQALLWVVLTLFFQHYLAALLVTEIMVWILEGIWLYRIPANRLSLKDALLLSLLMNLASVLAGWFLPV